MRGEMWLVVLPEPAVTGYGSKGAGMQMRVSLCASTSFTNAQECSISSSQTASAPSPIWFVTSISTFGLIIP